MATLLCTTGDVKRILRALDQDIDEYLNPLIESAEEEVLRITGRNFGAIGSVTERFYNVRQDGLLYLSDENPSGVSVTAFGSAASSGGYVMTANSSYQLQNEGVIQLMWGSAIYDPRVSDAPYSGQPLEYDRVDVTYIASGIVPKLVREACAELAASEYAKQPGRQSGYTSERLGDYSYSRSAADDETTPASVARKLSYFEKPMIRTV